MAQFVELKATRGDSLHLRFTYKNEDGTAYDLTGYSAYLTIKQNIDNEDDDDEAVYQSIQASITSPILGIVDFEILATATADLMDKYYFDHQLVNVSTGKVLTP